MQGPMPGAIPAVATFGGASYVIWLERRARRRAREKTRRAAQIPTHSVLVRFELHSGRLGSHDEREAIHHLTGELDRMIRSNGAGEFDGDEFGEGACTLFIYGPDADLLFRAVEPSLRSSPLVRGGTAIKRYGPRGSREELVAP